jgi:hypothetical protein
MPGVVDEHRGIQLRLDYVGNGALSAHELTLALASAIVGPKATQRSMRR